MKFLIPIIPARALLSTAIASFLCLSGFAQGNAPKDLNVSNVFGPSTEAAFYLDLEGSKKSGFMKKAEDEFPEFTDGLEDAKEDMSEFTEITGVAIEDLVEVAMSFTGVDAVFAAMESGEEPELDSNASILFAGRIGKPLAVDKLVDNVLAKIEEEEGPEVRKLIEGSRSNFQGVALFTMPKEFLEENDVPFSLSFGLRGVGKEGFFAIGKTREVKRFFSGGNGKKTQGNAFSSEVRKALPSGGQFWFSLPLPEALLDQATEELSENPMGAGFAKVIGKIREAGIGIHFKDESVALNLGLACEDAQSAVQMWTLSQGLLAMAKLAASSPEADIPPVVQKITSAAKEKTVLFSIDLTLDDLSAMAESVGGGLEPGGFEPEAADPEDLVGEDAPDFEIALLDGNDFKLSAVKGKKVVVLDFWATWCTPCVKALPEVRAATDALKDKGVVLVAVNQGERPADIQGFLKKRKWTGLTVGLDPESEVGDQFGVQGIPQTVIIDKEGVIREVHVGYGPNLEKRLLRELKEILAE